MNIPSTIISMVVFDGDDTLWYGLDGGYISGKDARDPGRMDYTFHALDEYHIQRSDGQRFRIYPEVRTVLPELVRRNVLISLASYNHRKPVLDALLAFEISHFFAHPIVEWSSRKDQMLKTILRESSRDGYLVSPQTTLFIDDDYRGAYRRQMASMNVHFLQKGVDIMDLTELLDHPRFLLAPIQKSLV